MPALPEFESFACKNGGCTEMLTAATAKSVCLQTGCACTSSAIACPKCGRLHWPNTKDAVYNRQQDCAFLTPAGNVENRPMPAAEKKAYIEETIAVWVKTIATQTALKDDLTYLIGKGHAPDCLAGKKRSKCTCGKAKAKAWLLRRDVFEVIDLKTPTQ